MDKLAANRLLKSGYHVTELRVQRHQSEVRGRKRQTSEENLPYKKVRDTQAERGSHKKREGVSPSWLYAHSSGP